MRLATLSDCTQKHGAIIVKGGRVISVGVNTMRNTPNDLIPSDAIAYHAEAAALRALGGNAQGAKIYVARLMRGGHTGLSRPCNSCYKAIVEAGIKEIIYT